MVDARCEAIAPLLSELVDGSIGDAERQRAEAHLASCGSCRALAADLRNIRDRAATLEPLAPPADLWPRIAATLAAERRAAPRLRPAARWLLAAAAVLTVAAGSALVWREVVRQAPESGGTAASAGGGNAGNAALVESVEAELKLAEQHFENAIAGLEAIVRAQDEALDPELAATLQKNLAIIDQAIAESRTALQAQPGSQLAQESLFGALRQKVALLQDTIALVNEMRRGDQAGAARIVGGLTKS